MVAAAIRDEQERLLLQQRAPGKRHAGQWELPGGKVDPGEVPRAALRREIAEELGVTLDSLSLCPIGFAEEQGERNAPAIVLLLYGARIARGRPVAREGQPWGWFSRAEALQLDLAPMDRALIEPTPLAV